MRRDELSLPDPPSDDRPGDRWMCGRSGDGIEMSSDPPRPRCSRGPDVDGRCPLAEACRPRRTWHGRRKQFAFFGLLVMVAIGSALTRPSMRASLVKPGELSTPHAQILVGTLDSQRCAACHPQATESPREWFASADSGHAGVTQNDRCMRCHHITIDESRAELAHNLPLGVRDEIRLASLESPRKDWQDWLPVAAVDQEDVHCSACHREHQGEMHDLTAMSNVQCQSCHADRFESFANGHPDWREWPYGRGGSISFNHSSHANKHFPATVRGETTASFQCADCHRRDANGELTRSTSYERACKSCHDGALRVESAEGLELLALPSVQADSANRIGAWPENATGFYDGQVTSIVDLLLRSDPELAALIRDLPDRDFANIDEANDGQVAAAIKIAQAHRTLMSEIASKGQQAIIHRGVESGITLATLETFVRSLSPQLVQEASRHWFGISTELASNENQVIEDARSEVVQLFSREATTGYTPGRESGVTLNKASSKGVRPVHFQSDDLLLDDSFNGDELLAAPNSSGDSLLSEDEALLGDDLLGSDPLDGDPLLEDSKASSKRAKSFIADSMLPAGGWYRDDVRMAIRYRGGGHDDPVIKAAIEMASQLPPGDPARERMFKSTAAAACIACHATAVAGAEGWHSRPLIGRKSEFTKFTHGPHLNIANLADCQHCHQIESAIAPLTMVGGAGIRHEFTPLGRQACASCHQSGAAGDSCVKCHRYHIDMR